MTSAFTSNSKTHREPQTITLPPATELFSDSYEQVIDKASIFICILNPTNRTNQALNNILNDGANAIEEALKDCGYDTGARLKRKRFSTKANLDEFLKEVKTMDFFDSSAVLLYWFGQTDDINSNGKIALQFDIFDIRDLWKPFVEQESLQGKPKINMFFTYFPPPIQSSVETDSCPRPKKSIDPYEAPREADVLIIYQKTNLVKEQDASSSYVKSFANNMVKLGRQYHICNLASINTRTDTSQDYPIVVSTLTRKFFVQPSQHRGIHLELDELTKGLVDKLNSIKKPGKRKPGGSNRPSGPPTPIQQPRESIKAHASNVASTSAQPKKTISIPQTERKPRSRLNSLSKAVDSKPPWKNYGK